MQALVLIGAAIAASLMTHPASPLDDTSKSSPQSPTATIDLTPIFDHFKLDRRRQGSRGTCSVFAVTGALEYALAVHNRAGERLSVEYLNWAGHKAANRTADGGFFHELWNGYEKSGICSEAQLPYRDQYDENLQVAPEITAQAQKRYQPGVELIWIKEWNPHTGLSDFQMKAIKTTLRMRWPVLGGLRWPKQAEWRQGVLQMRQPDEVFDGHSIIIVGYLDDPSLPGGGAFKIRNSGGDGSDGFLPYAYVQAYMNDAAWIHTQKGHPPLIRK